MVGRVAIGGGAPVSVQTMTNAPADDPVGTLKQICLAADCGCDLIRCAVPSVRHAAVFAEVVRQSPLPVVADIHFDCRIALAAIKAGAHKIRINPGNMGDWEAIALVVQAAKDAGIPIRIGVNSGSIKHKNSNDARTIPQALCEECIEYVARFEDMGFRDLVLSLKTPDPLGTIAVNRLVAKQCSYPLHLGVTEAGPEEEALLKSAIGIGALLADGIGDTIRLSFTAPPEREVLAAKQLLRAAGLLRDHPVLISCPTCGRTSVDLEKIVAEINEKLRAFTLPITVAVMGCEVNGPGEAKEADIGLAAGAGRMTLFKKGMPQGTFAPDEAVAALLAEIERMVAGRH
jgi:(E)-4-hydroxy-3-methylbut-2-enyl-diphosphate synthase